LAFIHQHPALMQLMLSDRRPLKDLGSAFADMRDRKVIKVAMEP
jgi:hypothetical protein